MHVKAKAGAGFGTEQMFVLQSINKPLLGISGNFLQYLKHLMPDFFLDLKLVFCEVSYSGCFLIL